METNVTLEDNVDLGEERGFAKSLFNNGTLKIIR
jgi:hypothetical protein